MSNEWDDDGWEVAVDRKKISRAVRRERKEAEAAAAAASGTVGGDEGPEFDAETARRMAAASFYGAAKGKQPKSSSSRRAASAEEEEAAGWTGGGPNPRAPKRKGKSKSTPAPSYSTADELAEALADIVARVPPTAAGLGMTVAALGDRLQTLTKSAWNKKYKSEFGSFAKFLAARPEFVVQGDEVRLATDSDKKAASKAGKGKAASAAAAGKSGAQKQQKKQQRADEDESEEEEEEDEEEEESESPKAARRVREKSSSSVCSLGTVVSALVLAGAVAGYLYFTQHLKH